MRKILTLVLITGAVTCLCLLCACNTTTDGRQGVDMDGPQAVVNLFPSCPTLPEGTTPEMASALISEWLSTLKAMAGSLPAGLQVTQTATIERNVSGSTDAGAEIDSAITATLEGLK